MKYQPPFDPGFSGPVDGIHNPNPVAPYVNGNPATGQAGSIPPMEALDHPMKELEHLIAYSGQDPSHLDLEQVRKAIRWMIDFLIEIGKSGDGVDLYHGNDDGVYLLRSLVAGDNITLTVLTNGVTGRTSIKIDAASGGGGGPSGEANTASNVGAAGVPVFKDKNGLDLRFRKIYGANGASVTQDGDMIKIEAPGTPQALATVAPVMMVHEVRPANVAVRSLVVNAWTQRPLNTVVINQIAGASLADERITLPAGTYRVQFAGSCWRGGLHITRLYNVTDSVVVTEGISCDDWDGGGNGSSHPSTGIAHFTIAATKTFSLQTFTIENTSKMGNGDQLSVAALNGYIEIIKEA